MKTFMIRLAIAAVALVAGGLSVWLMRPSIHGEIDALSRQARCTLVLTPGAEVVAAPFTLPEAVARFHVGLRPGRDDELLRLSLVRDEVPVFQATLSGTMRFGSEQHLPAGTYTAVLEQVAGTHGGFAAISDRGPEPGATGWQIYAGSFTLLMLAAGLWSVVARSYGTPRQVAISRAVFLNLSLACLGLFMYLLFHEGGHALGAMAFGRFDLSRADFWGVHGSPHAGGIFGPTLQPWQQAVISGGGILGPTFAGWALFLMWRSPIGKRLRPVWPLASLYFGAVLIMALLPSVAIVGYVVGVAEDGDWKGFIGNVPEPLWLVKGLLLGALAANGWILWCVAPEWVRAWKAQISRAASEQER